MPEYTPKLNLKKPLPPEDALISDINSNMDKIDDSSGVKVVTSTTRPAQPYQGQLIFETNTAKLQVWNGSAWVEIRTPVEEGSPSVPYSVSGNHSYITWRGGGAAREHAPSSSTMLRIAAGMGTFTAAPQERTFSFSSASHNLGRMPFIGAPIVVCQLTGASAPIGLIKLRNVTTASFAAEYQRADGNTHSGSRDMHWIAIGRGSTS